MPAPATTDEFLSVVERSGVADQKRLKTFMATAGDLPEEPARLAALLIQEGVLTRFQSEQMLQGKWRGFAIGNYKVLERLGSGGMGNVYLCEHKDLKKRVAIKVLATVSAENPEALKRFYREARAAAALDHPHIARAHDIGKEDKLHFLVMDYVDGSSLDDIVRKHGPMEPLRAAHYIAQAAEGLQYAHDEGLVHRDIKPANLILDRAGVVRILDMGVARFAQSEDEEVLTKGPLGTADYLAPEQALDSHGVDFRADVYSLGATLYYLLTQNPPFADGKTVAKKILMLQTQKPQPISHYRDDVPAMMQEILEKMMAKKPDDRYSNLKELIDDLKPWTDKPIAPPPEKEMPHLSPAAQGAEGTDPNLGMTPAPGGKQNIPSPAPGTAASPAPAAAATAPAQAAPPSQWVTILLTVVITATVVTGLWYFLLRPGQ